MSLLDKLKTNLSSFDYSKVGTTKNYDNVEPSSFQSKGISDLNPNKGGIHDATREKIISPNYNQGKTQPYTLFDEPQKNDFIQPNFNPFYIKDGDPKNQSILTSEKQTMSGITFNGKFSSDWFTPNFNPFYIKDGDPKNQSILTSEKQTMSETNWPGGTNFIDTDGKHSKGFTLDSQEGMRSQFIGVNKDGTEFTQTGGKYDIDGSFKGPVNFINEGHAKGFKLNRQERDESQFVGVSKDGIEFTQTGGKYGIDGSFKGPVNFISDTHAKGFTLESQERGPSQFIGVRTGEPVGLEFHNTGLKYEMSGVTFPGPVNFFKNTHATGFTLERQEKDPTEYIEDISLFDDGVGTLGIPQFIQDGTFQIKAIDGVDPNKGGIHGVTRDSVAPFVFGGHNLSILENQTINEISENMSDVNLVDVDQGYGGSTEVGKGQIIKLGDISLTGDKFDVKQQFGQFINQTIASEEFLDSAYDKFGGHRALREHSRENQPYIIREIGQRFFGFIGGDESPPLIADSGLFRGGIVTQLDRVRLDTERIGKFLLSPKGIVWNLKQFVLQSMNARPETRLYNILSTPLSVTNLFHEPRHIDLNPFRAGLGGFRVPRYEEYVHTDAEEASFVKEAAERTGEIVDLKTSMKQNWDKAFPKKKKDQTKDENKAVNSAGKVETGVSAKEIAQRAGAGGTALFKGVQVVALKAQDKLKGVRKLAVEVSYDTDLQVPYQGTYGNIKELNDGKDFPKDLIKFRIRDAVNGKWIIFPAYLEDISDNSSAEYSTEKYIGRPDSVHIYNGFTRNISLSFKVAALSRNDLPIIWEKLNALKGLTTPTFKKFLSLDKEVRPVSPYVYLTIGDMFNNTPGYFSSVNVQINNTTSWEISDGVQYPHVADVSCEFVYIGKGLPNTLGKHYDIPWLEDAGVGEDKFGVFDNIDPKEKEAFLKRYDTKVDGDNITWDKWLSKQNNNTFGRGN